MGAHSKITMKVQAITISLFLSMSSLFGSALAQSPQAQTHYTNVRFHYSICYPADLFIPQGESENSDGQIFLAKDGTELRVWGGNNINEQSITAEMEENISYLTKDGGTVTYKTSKSNWFVISGKIGEKIYYQKTIRNKHNEEDIFITYSLTYDVRNTSRYEPLIGVLNACFQPSPK